MNQDAFPFFDWVHNALYFLFHMILTFFEAILLWLARICDLLVLLAVGTGERVFGGFIGPFANWLSVFFGDAITRVLSFFVDFFEWLWSHLADTLGVALLWFDAQLPPSLSLNISGLLIVVSYLKSVTYLIDVPFVLATATVGIGMAWSIQLVKVIVRLTPFIG